MSLTDILKFRYPLVWLHTHESETFIVNLANMIDDRLLYVFDEFDGLTVWDEDALDFKIITTEVYNPHTEEKVDMPLTRFPDAFQYAFDKGTDAIFTIRNFHKCADDYLNVVASLFNKYYRALRFDALDQCPLTVMCLSTEAEIPEEIRAMTVFEAFGPPTESALTELLSFLATKIPVEDAIPEDHIPEMAKACRGMGELDVINTVFNLVRKNGGVAAEDIAKIKYDRLKAMSSLDIIQPRVSLADVGGLDYAKSIIMRAHWIRSNPEEAKAKGVSPINKILLLGLSGVGKSLICEAAAKTLGLDLAKFGVAGVMTKWIGESERKMREAFQEIHTLAPIAVWIDELGRDFQGGDYDGGTTNRVHGTLLTGLQELPDDVALFAAANDVSSLPPEMLRAERFDKILFVGYPAYSERIEIFKINLGENSSHDFEQLALSTSFYTGAEIVDLIKQTRFDRLLEDGNITTQNILETRPKMKNRLWVRHTGLVQQMYKIAEHQHEWASTEQYNEIGSVLSGTPYNPSGNSAPSGIRVKS